MEINFRNIHGEKMRFSVVSRKDDNSTELMHVIKDKFEKFGGRFDDANPELVVSIGGDGTLLHAFHNYKHSLDKIFFVGIHTGHLGFYTDWKVEEVDELVEIISKGNPKIVEYPLVEMIVTNSGGRVFEYLALNEATIHAACRILQIDVEIQGSHFESFRGDGLCFSTPSGSTAYNKAVGGAVVHPTLRAMQMAEIASINNRVFRTIGSPIILPAHHICVLKPTSDDMFKFSVDQMEFSLENVSQVEFRVSKSTIKFARYREFPFWKRVHDSFIAN